MHPAQSLASDPSARSSERRPRRSGVGGGAGRGGADLLHLWDELEERVREQRSNGQRDEVSEHAAEKHPLRARQDEDSQERGQVNQ